MNFFLSIAFGLIQKYLVGKITYLPLREWVSKAAMRFEEIAGLMTDGNKDNATQLKNWWEANKHDIADDSVETAIRIVEERVKDSDAKEIVLKILRSLDADGNIAPNYLAPETDA